MPTSRSVLSLMFAVWFLGFTRLCLWRYCVDVKCCVSRFNCLKHYADVEFFFAAAIRGGHQERQLTGRVRSGFVRERSQQCRGHRYVFLPLASFTLFYSFASCLFSIPSRPRCSFSHSPSPIHSCPNILLNTSLTAFFIYNIPSRAEIYTLLMLGADVNMLGPGPTHLEGMLVTPLISAVLHNDVVVLELLLQNGADMFVTDTLG